VNGPHSICDHLSDQARDHGRFRFTWFAALALLASLAACSPREEGPRWIDLTQDFVPRDEGGSVRRSFRLPREGWQPGPAGLWWTRLPLPFYRPDRAGLQPPGLTVGGQGLEPFERGRAFALLEDLEAGWEQQQVAALRADLPSAPCFGVAHDVLFVFLAEGAPAPDEALLEATLDQGASEGGRWRVSLGPVRAAGIPLFCGGREERTVDFPPDSTLRFATVALGRDEAGDRTRFRVTLEGDELFELAVAPDPRGRPSWHALPLGPSQRRGARLVFEVDGAPCLSAFLAPVIGPSEVGVPGARPWAEQRRDVLLISADTFRADNLAVHGGEPRWTPHLNRLARESLVFLQARSTSCWTLPSHVSLLAGLHPYQGARNWRRASLSAEAVTLAERFADAGYRTLAVTERGFVSRTYGLDQGFEWFRERRSDVAETTQALDDLLVSDDGRPLFVFFHTYRAHHPYRASVAARERLGITDDWEDLVRVAEQLPSAPAERAPAEQAWLERKLALYRGGASDLDAAIGSLRALLEERGRWEATAVVFTSDHGEAFGEHGVAGHGVGLWGEEVRVPLLVRGPSVVPGTVEEGVSLVALPRTLSALAGLEAWEGWAGSDLLASDRRGPVWAFQCSAGAPNRATLIHGSRKIIVDVDLEAGGLGALRFAYDLASDPAEQHDLSASQAPWPGALMEAFAARASLLFEPLVGEDRAGVSPSQAAELRDLGYAGDS
jgi:arylsulfatase A-like enzyme